MAVCRWQGHYLEVKTTDAYRIDLDRIAGYRRSLIRTNEITEDDSSILIVVGREDTGNLEAQIRGSKHAWDIRLTSVDALIRLMKLKEDIEDPLIERKIRDILMPQEFTRVDGIIDLVFFTTEDVKQEEEMAEEVTEDDSETYAERMPKFKPVSFHDACAERIQVHLGKSLVRRSRAIYTSPDGSLAVVCAVSREHENNAGARSYWYAFHPHQKETLEKADERYVAYGCGSDKQILLIPYDKFIGWLDGMNVTKGEDRFYWHVSIFKQDDRLMLHRRRGYERVDLTPYLLSTADIS